MNCSIIENEPQLVFWFDCKSYASIKHLPYRIFFVWSWSSSSPLEQRLIFNNRMPLSSISPSISPQWAEKSQKWNIGRIMESKMENSSSSFIYKYTNLNSSSLEMSQIFPWTIVFNLKMSNFSQYAKKHHTQRWRLHHYWTMLQWKQKRDW